MDQTVREALEGEAEESKEMVASVQVQDSIVIGRNEESNRLENYYLIWLLS